jgi:hypothetical protein
MFRTNACASLAVRAATLASASSPGAPKREQAQERDMDMTFWLEGAKAEINVLWSDALGA